MQRSYGFILLTLLVFLQIVTWLGLAMLQTAIIAFKQSHALWHKHVEENNAEYALLTAERKLIQSMPACVFSPIAEKNLLMQLISTSSCAGNFPTFQYYYVVEFLGTDPCAIVQEYPKKQVADYYRLSLLGIEDGAKIILQSTVVLPHLAMDPLICNSLIHNVSRGRQMWRELI